jgi:outer membrane protein assembly factor BamB
MLHPHRRTVIRVAIATVVAIGVLAGIGGAIRSLRADGGPTIDPGNVDRLATDWSSDPDAGPISGLATEGGVLYVSSEQGLVGFRVPCVVANDDPCRPSWRDVVPDGPLSVPVVSGGHVYAGSASGLVYSFPADCQASGCTPEWVGVAGKGAVSQPAVNDDFVYVTSNRLYAFPSVCGTDDRPCPPAWSASIPGVPATGPPAVGGGLVIVSSGAENGGVYAFPAVCNEPCRPVWTGITQGPATAAAIEGDSAYVIARGRLLAFPLSCRGPCPPSWTGTVVRGKAFDTGTVSRPAPAGDLIYVGAQDGTLWVFPASCPLEACDAARSYPLATVALEVPVVEDGVVYATSTDGALHAVVDVCDPLGETCDPPWASVLGASTEAAPAVGQGGVFAGDDRGTIHAFALRSP